MNSKYKVRASFKFDYWEKGVTMESKKSISTIEEAEKEVYHFLHNVIEKILNKDGIEVEYDKIIYVPDDYTATFESGERLFGRLEGKLCNEEGELFIDILG
ncbi:hypothetical protein [Brassicibacter mesophilus]|uniref:hypothetical protein n=1 Tax=Brassicibacter mesophilus TaxID=745119 RepID=UPI003D1E0FB6